jgi:hypothetical protein
VCSAPCKFNFGSFFYRNANPLARILHVLPCKNTIGCLTASSHCNQKEYDSFPVKKYRLNFLCKSSFLIGRRCKIHLNVSSKKVFFNFLYKSSFLIGVRYKMHLNNIHFVGWDKEKAVEFIFYNHKFLVLQNGSPHSVQEGLEILHWLVGNCFEGIADK